MTTRALTVLTGALAGALAVSLVAPPTLLRAAADKKAVFGGAKPIGPYTPGVDIGSLVFLSGQIGLDPATGKLVEGGTTAEARQAMENLAGVLKEAGLGFNSVVKTTIFLADINDFAAVNEIYAGFFPEGGTPPARSTVAVAALPRGARIEIELVAAR
jgi:2-iminobutanoate/2-iminopropanoate deaminase